jgi:hypothetical protein
MLPIANNKVLKDVESSQLENVSGIEQLLVIDGLTTILSREPLSLQTNQLLATLRQLYVNLTSFCEMKLGLLRCTQEITQCYEENMRSLAEEHGVLQSSVKFHLTASSTLNALVSHKLFVTEEVRW